LPGVEYAAMTTLLPLSGFNSDMGFSIEGRPAPPRDVSRSAWYQAVTPSYLAAVGTGIVRGRGIAETDGPESTRVVVINETFARRHFGGEGPLGQRVNFDDPANPVWWEIVGVAQDTRHFDLRGAVPPALYVPFTQLPSRTLFFAVRSARAAASVIADVRAVLALQDPELSAGQIDSLDQLVGNSLAPEHFVSLLVGLFAASALSLAAVGLYGVVSHHVNARMREMGVRRVLGAGPKHTTGLILRDSMLFVGVGLALGLAGSAGLTRLLGTLLYGVEHRDPATFLTALVVLGSAALLAGLLPARRAARVDPAEVLKEG
jgi:putative ABC transport system permease protein